MSDDQDWRLEAGLDTKGGHGLLDRVLGGVRAQDREIADELQADVPAGVVITHDGQRLFAYTATRQALNDVRAAVERELDREGVAASVSISHWDHDLDDWRQIDPAPAPADTRGEDIAVDDAKAVDTQTLVCSAGKGVQATVEQSMRAWAGRLGLTCQTVEHPHLLTTQVAFTVTGPHRKIDEFREGLKAEALRTIRSDSILTNPL